MDADITGKPVDAAYFDGHSSRLHRVTLQVRDGVAQVRGEAERDSPLAELRVSERSVHALRKITFPDGAYLEVRDLQGLASLLHSTGHADGWVVRLQQSWRGALAAAVGTLAVIGLGYVYVLPAAADLLARNMPASMEQQLGQGVLATLDRHMFEPSRFSEQRMAALSERFRQLQPPGGEAPSWRLVFRKSRIGPNAFALPSGDIVLTDEMVRLLEDDEAVMGVLAHELGHLHQHHITRRIIQGAVVASSAAMLFGDVSSLLTAAPAALVDMKYSRDAERDADAYAIAMLRHNGVPLEHLLTVFERLHKFEQQHGLEMADYLSSHPAGAERIERVRAAMRQQ
ncbi:M48 family metallopeptidase [Duganella sp. sic0402]|uniref:M48 family metallopeptidase n=1 Tax=Duganella sp. sic0402 TaxID=2854786 RepID=UPI001C47C972|nr:M48 family metallopeptidase [Duganella sp. sic0402]MBV7537330.1 M48 family metallopeptidase [Duganella sp. sic0402]